MGGKSKSSNDQVVQMQMQQAAQAKEKEAERSARLQSGTQAINNLFDGAPSDQKSLDLSGLASVDPNSYYAGSGVGTAGSTGANYGLGGNFASLNNQSNPWAAILAQNQANKSGAWWNLADGYKVVQTPDNGTGKTGWGINDANGNLVTSAATLGDLSKMKVGYGGTDGAAKTGGIGNDFYDKYKQAELNYYLPEVDRQYQDQKTQANYALARSGTLQSSEAGHQLSDLVYQRDLNNAQMTAKADQDTGALRQSVSANKQAAINQLYSTEDPTLAANTATSLVKNTELTTPMLNPIGQLFKPLAIGIGSGLSGYANASAAYGAGFTPSSSSSNVNSGVNH